MLHSNGIRRPYLNLVTSDARMRWEADQDDNDKRLQYSSLLGRSSSAHDNAEALLHLRYLTDSSYSLRETLFELATLHYYMEDFSAARYFCEELCRIDPESKQIRSLHRAICYKFSIAAAHAQEEQREVVVTTTGILLGIAAVGLGIAFSMRKK